MMTHHLSSAPPHRDPSHCKRVRSAKGGYPVRRSATLARNGSVLAQRARGLLLLAGFGLAICSASAAHADHRGTLGPVSKGSIGISITVLPQVQVMAGRIEGPGVGRVASTRGGQFCLTTNMPEGEFTVTLESIGADSVMQNKTRPVAIDNAPSDRCSLASTNENEAKAVALAMGSEVAPQHGLALLIVSPE